MWGGDMGPPSGKEGGEDLGGTKGSAPSGKMLKPPNVFYLIIYAIIYNMKDLCEHYNLSIKEKTAFQKKIEFRSKMRHSLRLKVSCRKQRK
jgi:hypothetical protein